MKKTDILIIGAGLSGLAAAWRLERSGKKYILAEKENRAGGLASSVFKNGFVFDYSGHLLHLRGEKTKKTILKLLGGNYSLIKRKAFVHSFGRFQDFPFQANLKNLPENVKSECVLEFIKAKTRNLGNPEKTAKYFDEWCLAAFGKGISRHFMFPYNSKLWRYPLNRLTTEWCSSFVPKTGVDEVMKGAYFARSSGLGYNSFFYYPKKGGIQALAGAFAGKIKKPLYGAEITKIDHKKKEAKIAGGETVKYDFLVNTMPLRTMIKRLKNPPRRISGAAGRLKNNRVYVLNLGIKPVSDKTHWLYFPEKEFPFYRMGISSNFSGRVSPPGTSSLYIETSARRPLDLEKLETEIVEKLKTLSFIKNERDIVEKLWMKIDPAYVIYDGERTAALEKITPFLERHKIFSIGRYGAWKYSFMEENISEGLKTAERIISNT